MRSSGAFFSFFNLIRTTSQFIDEHNNVKNRFWRKKFVVIFRWFRKWQFSQDHNSSNCIIRRTRNRIPCWRDPKSNGLIVMCTTCNPTKSIFGSKLWDCERKRDAGWMFGEDDYLCRVGVAYKLVSLCRPTILVHFLFTRIQNARPVSIRIFIKYLWRTWLHQDKIYYFVTFICSMCPSTQ